MFKIIVLLFLTSINANAIVKIAIIDSGYDNKKINIKECDESLNLTSEPLSEDTIGHGTVIAKILSENIATPVNYCLMIIKVFSKNNMATSWEISKAIEFARVNGATFLNMSFVGYSYSKLEAIQLSKFIDKGNVAVVAAGNDDHNLDVNCVAYPACADKRAIVVGSFNTKSNKGQVVDVYANGIYIHEGRALSGTSIATPRVLGLLINNVLQYTKDKDE